MEMNINERETEFQMEKVYFLLALNKQKSSFSFSEFKLESQRGIHNYYV